MTDSNSNAIDIRATCISIRTSIAAFLASPKVATRGQVTQDIYARMLEAWASWLEASGVCEADESDIAAYLETLKATKAPATVRLHLAAIRLYYKWAAAHGGTDIAADAVPPRRVAEPSKAYLDGDELSRLVGVQDRTTEAGKRDYAIIALMAACGLRVSEVASADVGDLRVMGGREVLYIKGKGHVEKDDFVPVPGKVLAAIQDYLGIRDDINEGAPLFAGRDHRYAGARLTSRSISKICKTAMVKAGMDDSRHTAHSLRHSFCTNAIKAGVSLTDVQSMARHADPATTMIYVHIVEKEQSQATEKVAALFM